MTMSERQFWNAVYRDDTGALADPPLSILQILNKVFDADNNALRLAGVSGSGAGLLKTGQTTSYHVGDDGDLEEGIAHDFTVLTTDQYAGLTAITINGKTCNLSNNCVKDNNTGLMWARYIPQTDIGPGANGKLFWEQWTLEDKTTISFDSATKEIRDSANGFDTAALCAGRKFAITNSALNNNTFTVVSITAGVIVVSEAVTDEAAGASVTVTTVDDLIWNAVDQANAKNFSGYNDWRVPNKTELQSIVDIGHYGPCIDSAVFPSTPSSYIWTSSTVPGYSTRAFYVTFYGGGVSSFLKAQSRYYLRLVRG